MAQQPVCICRGLGELHPRIKQEGLGRAFRGAVGMVKRLRHLWTEAKGIAITVFWSALLVFLLLLLLSALLNTTPS